MGVLVALAVPRLRLEAKGEMQIMLERPFLGLLSVLSSRLGVSPRARPATSEKKKDVLTLGVPGVRGIKGPLGVFMMEFSPPGENNPLAVGDCNQFNTLDVSKVLELFP